MTVVAMSHGDLSRFDTLMRVERGELRVEDAAFLLGLKRRQVFRLLERLRTEGASGLVSRKRGRPSNRRHDDGSTVWSDGGDDGNDWLDCDPWGPAEL